jgi:hypothetical protein
MKRQDLKSAITSGISTQDDNIRVGASKGDAPGKKKKCCGWFTEININYFFNNIIEKILWFNIYYFATFV